eukprot:598285-Rhodomonas_salina.1
MSSSEKRSSFCVRCGLSVAICRRTCASSASIDAPDALPSPRYSSRANGRARPSDRTTDARKLLRESTRLNKCCGQFDPGEVSGLGAVGNLLEGTWFGRRYKAVAILFEPSQDLLPNSLQNAGQVKAEDCSALLENPFSTTTNGCTDAEIA